MAESSKASVASAATCNYYVLNGDDVLKGQSCSCTSTCILYSGGISGNTYVSSILPDNYHSQMGTCEWRNR